ncbi:hypothetical protein FA09DRAFT_358243, partial [Tilletiopsis washingtonensis]
CLTTPRTTPPCPSSTRAAQRPTRSRTARRRRGSAPRSPTSYTNLARSTTRPSTPRPSTSSTTVPRAASRSSCRLETGAQRASPRPQAGPV